MSNHTKAPWLFDGKVVYALNEKGVNIFLRLCMMVKHAKMR